MRRSHFVCWLACVALFALCGCGGTTHTKSSGASSGRTTTQAAVPLPPGALGKAAAALQAAGYTAQSYTGSAADRPAAVGRLQVTKATGPSVNVALYRSSADAASAASQLRKALGSATVNGKIEQRGPRVYYTGQRTALTAADRTSFAKVVHVVEGT